MSGKGSRTTAGLVKLNLTIHPDHLERLDRFSDTRHIARSVIIREAILEKLDRLESGAPVLVQIERAG